MTNVLSPYAKQQFFNNNGGFNSGGTITTYAAGTSTPIATYTSSGATNTNPVTLNARGECDLWLLPNTGYKFVLADAAGNTIWTVDNIVNAQLLTLFGGVDSGASNTYLLNFTAAFSAYVNGTVIYWIASNSNTGASTLNVNGLGAIPITNIDGSALGSNQIVAGATVEVMYYNGAFQLLSIGSFTGATVGTFGAEVPLPSASTVDLGSAPAHVVQITGTTAITSFGSSANTAAPIYAVRFSSSLTLTYNATSMILPGAASIVTNPGDAILAQYLGGGNWKVLFYQSVSGGQTAKIKASDTAIVSNATLTPDPDLLTGVLAVGRYTFELCLIFDSVSGTAGFKFTNDGTAADSRTVVPSVAMGYVNGAAYGPKSESFYGNTITFATVGTAANSNEVIYKGALLVGTAGTFGVSWAQGTSTASATTLRAGSYLSLSLVNTGVSANTVQRIYQTPGNFIETIPVGFSTLTAEVWGGSGAGGTRYQSGSTIAGGGGGASGGYARSVISVVGLGGDTLNFTVGVNGVVGVNNGGDSTISSGTLTITTMTGGGGKSGANATGGNTPGAGGTGGTASGGTSVNLTGNAGAAGLSSANGGNGGTGGFGIPGINYGGYGGGVGGGAPGVGGQPGGVGIVVFTYSP
jgi:hypothetical protein